MEEFKGRILKTMIDPEVSDGHGANMALVADKLDSDWNDTHFQEVVQELVTEQRIRFYDSISAEVV